jgi:hydrogenase-1 operon protein HyaF
MTALAAFAEDGLVDALLMQIAGLLGRLAEHDEEGSIDLRGLPLSASCIADLEKRLGRGEVTAVIEAAGRSTIHETSFPGVWWISHADESGRMIANLIEVALVPMILRADPADIILSQRRLPGCTHVAAHARARAA